MINGAESLRIRANGGIMKHLNQSVSISMVYPILKTLVHKGFDPESFSKRWPLILS